MKTVVSLTLFVCLGLAVIPAQASDLPTEHKPAAASPPPFMTVDEVRPGMKGVAYTVFQGATPETMGVEVLGVIKNMIGPKSDLILFRIQGEKA
jgi:hypothetical protein